MQRTVWTRNTDEEGGSGRLSAARSHIERDRYARSTPRNTSHTRQFNLFFTHRPLNDHRTGHCNRCIARHNSERETDVAGALVTDHGTFHRRSVTSGPAIFDKQRDR